MLRALRMLAHRLVVLFAGLIAMATVQPFAAPLCAQVAPPPENLPPLDQAIVADVQLEGNQTVEIHRITPHIQTRPGRPFSLETVADDVRRLTKARLFINVDTTYQRTADGGVIVIFRVVESPRLEYVKYVGSTLFESQLAKQTGLKAGDPLDTYMVVEARRKLQEYYESKGYAKARVTIMEGDKAGDRGAIFLINEGKRQRIWRTEFIGNTISSDARLRTQIESKNPFFYLFGGEVSRSKIDHDVERLTAYYRSLGFFRARIGREIQYNDAENWVTVTFVIDEGPRYRIRDISFIGNKKISTEELAALTELRSGTYFDQGLMSRDVGAIQDKYGGSGYIFATVQPDPRFLEEPGELDLVYQIQEGDRYRVGRVNVNIGGENPRTRRTTVMNYVSLKPGDIADSRKLRDDEVRLQRSSLFANNPAQGAVPKIVFREPNLDELERQFAEEERNMRGQSPDPGFGQVPLGRTGPDAYGQGTGQVYRDPQTGQWQTAQYVPPAAQAYPPGTTYPATPAASPSYAPPGGYQPAAAPSSAPFGAPPMAPATAAPPANVLYQQPVTYPPGAPPALSLPNAGAPAGIYPPPQGYATPGDLVPQGILNSPRTWLDRTADVDINVDETQTGRLMLGLGVSSAAGLVGNIVVEEQNFDWRKFPRSFSELFDGRAFRGGGQRFRIEATPGSQVSRYMFQFQQPFLFDGPVSFSLSGYYYQRFFRDWNEQRGGGSVGLGYQFPTMPNLTVGGALRGESVKLFDPRIPTPAQVAAVVGTTSVYTARFNITHDTRDSTFIPTQGHYLELAYEQGFGQFDYPRGTIDARQHFLLRERADHSGRHTFTVASTLGVTGTQTPVYENFFAGYPNFRGFAFRGASPQELGTQVGGRFQWINSAEYMFPITADDMLRGVAFCDFGTVEPVVQLKGSSFRVAPVLGLRITLPMMGPAPIALDFSAPVMHAPGDQIQNFQFFVGLNRF